MRRISKALILLAATFLSSAVDSEACTNVLVTKGASTDGSNMVSYAADSHQLYGELYYAPAGVWNAGDMRQINEWDTGKFLGYIPQPARTYQRVGNMNEHQLIIAETTYGGRPELEGNNGIMDYGSLIYVALERAKTAREAIEVIVDLANTYGYYSSGESFSIADTEEVWTSSERARTKRASYGLQEGFLTDTSARMPTRPASATSLSTILRTASTLLT